ncbi:MAG: cadmium-translocating P-type ATPase [Clostridia bacterium]|nr:cadmium-translocating P-type ATPase [Clostridia bacterium]
MKKILQLQGLDCAGCAAELERKISKLEGVSSASIAFVNQKLTVEYQNEETLQKIINEVNAFEEVQVINGQSSTCTCAHCHTHEHAHEHEHQHVHAHHHEDNHEENNAFKKAWLLIALSTVFLIFGYVSRYIFTGAFEKIFGGICCFIAYIAVGYPVLNSTIKNLRKGKIFDENFLMTIASLGAIVIGETGEGVLVMLLYQIGETLQAIAVGSSRTSLRELMELKSEWATLIKNGKQVKIKPEELKVGDIIVVKDGEKIPVDGILLSEKAILDTKSLTGEAQLKTVVQGEEMLSGCINTGGMYEMKVLRPYQDSAVGRILDMVENASAGKAKPEKFITKFARFYTPIVCSFAVFVAFFLPLLNGIIVNGTLYFKDIARWVQTALTFLVISCPCALIISVPLTYFSGIGACAKNGILVKGATYLDTAATAKIVAFDKTGTLTEGNFEIISISPTGKLTEKELVELVATVERGSAHPIAQAFVNVNTSFIAENVREVSGKGVIATINDEQIFVGNEQLMKENGLSIIEKQSAYTLIYVVKNTQFLGWIEIGDKLRAESENVISMLKKMGMKRLVMLTGDREERAIKIGNEVGLYEVNSNLLPDQKLKRAEELKKDGVLIYVGDGVNDAPVMVTADVAVSMGTLGSAAAIEASDMVLISDDLGALPKGVQIARKTRKIVLQNIIFSIIMKTLFMALGLVGVLPLWLAVFADVGVMLLAVCNSFRVRL